MPPVNQGSKAALITWTVIATVFGITMAVLALITYAGKNDVQAQLNAERTQFNNFASAADLQGARLTELSQQAQAQNTGNVYRLLTNREETLAQSATGTTRFENATATIDSTLERLNSQYEGINAASLVDAIQLLETRLADMRRQAQVLQQAQEELTAELQRNAETSQQQLAQKDEMIAGLTEQLEEVQAMFRTVEERKTELETGSTQSIADLRANWEEQLRQAEDRLTQVTRALESSQRQVQILTQQNKDRFGGDQMIASPDGRVIRSPSQGRLYINLGRNQGVTNGMTFQVYDSVRGIPKATEDNPSELPIGKGSIQVIRVDPNSAEARVVSQQPGQSIREGDLIANLAYDRNVPVRFRIYGDFDLDHDGETHPRDYDRMLTITREFGGRIVDDVTVETDVLVLGQEPVVPNYTPEQLQDPIYNQQYTNAVTRRDAYLSVRNQAQQLNIPILNQNQFLYYVGYFEQVGR